MRFCIRHRPFDSAYLLYVVIALRHSHCLHSPFLKTIIPNYLPKSEFPFRISALEWKRAYHPSQPPAQPSTPLLRSTASFVTQGSIFCCATKSAPLPISKTPNLQVTKVKNFADFADADACAPLRGSASPNLPSETHMRFFGAFSNGFLSDQR
jgi:hypothetical protein